MEKLTYGYEWIAQKNAMFAHVPFIELSWNLARRRLARTEDRRESTIIHWAPLPCGAPPELAYARCWRSDQPYQNNNWCWHRMRLGITFTNNTCARLLISGADRRRQAGRQAGRQAETADTFIIVNIWVTAATKIKMGSNAATNTPIRFYITEVKVRLHVCSLYMYNNFTT